MGKDKCNAEMTFQIYDQEYQGSVNGSLVQHTTAVIVNAKATKNF